MLNNVLLGAPTLAQSVLMPPAESNHAAPVDFAMAFINYVTVIFFVVIIALMVFFAYRFRRKDPTQRAESQTSHNTVLELTWTIPPFIVVMYTFYLGITGYLQIQTVPENAYTIMATGQKWSWTFTHPNGNTDVNLHVPANEPVKLLLQSTDVLHSVFIPAFRVKKDAVPGRYNYTWFIAQNPTPDHDGEGAVENGHILYCTEYCGTNHSTMLARVIVHPEGWRPAPAGEITEITPEAGQKVFALKGCVGCHQVQAGGPPLPGPSFAGGLFGRQEELATGETVTVDEAYVRESILQPQAKIVAGYATVPMPPLPLTDKELDAVIEYLKSLGGDAAQ